MKNDSEIGLNAISLAVGTNSTLLPDPAILTGHLFAVS